MESIAQVSAILDSTRELNLDISTARTVNSRPVSKDVLPSAIKRMIESRHDREVLDGLRRVISMIYLNKPCLEYFSAVVKNVASPNIEIKKLVYIYLLQYAEAEPDLALLSVNTIQKSLTDHNPQVRAMAIRVMSGMRVPVISQIVSLAIKRGIVDMSPYVRKAAALAIPKCYRLDPGTLPHLIEYTSTLLSDKQYFVVGPAVTTFLTLCPDRVDLIHTHYHSLIKKLVDMDEWAQISTLQLLTRYVRSCFPRRSKKIPKTNSIGSRNEAGTVNEYEADEDAPVDNDIVSEDPLLDPDLELFIKVCKGLLSSRNSAVIVTATKALLSVGRSEDLDAAIGPLVALLRTSPDIRYVATYNIVAICLIRPHPFVRYCMHFLIRSDDATNTICLKFEILTLIFQYCNSTLQELILSEFEHFMQSYDTVMVRESVRALGRCAQTDATIASRCLQLLLHQVSSQDDNLVGESLTVIRFLIQRDPSAHRKTVIQLARNLNVLQHPKARASIIWLVGEFSGLPEKEDFAPDVLRILAQGFCDESEEAKLQIVTLAAKVYLHYLLKRKASVSEKSDLRDDPSHGFHLSQSKEVAQAEVSDGQSSPSSIDETSSSEENHPIPLLWTYILALVRYDLSYDLRDRTRVYSGLLCGEPLLELASAMLFATKPAPHIESPSETRRNIMLGTTSLVLGNTAQMKGYEDMQLPEWVKDGNEPDPKLRGRALPDVANTEDLQSRSEWQQTGPSKVSTPAARQLDEAIWRDESNNASRDSSVFRGRTEGAARTSSAIMVPPSVIPSAMTQAKNLDDWLNESDDDDVQRMIVAKKGKHKEDLEPIRVDDELKGYDVNDNDDLDEEYETVSDDDDDDDDNAEEVDLASDEDEEEATGVGGPEKQRLIREHSIR